MARTKTLLAALSGAAIMVAGVGVPLVAGPASAADPAPRTATLAGSLQSELGCPADWSPDCTSTDLVQVGNTTAYAKVFTVPAGTYEFKVAINHSWDENYGAGGAANGANIPLVLKGAAQVEFSYDDVTHQVGMRPLKLSKSKAKLAWSCAMAGPVKAVLDNNRRLAPRPLRTLRRL